MDPSDKNHAFHNPTLSPDEELSKRGYSMYMGSDGDLESGRGTERYVGSSSFILLKASTIFYVLPKVLNLETKLGKSNTTTRGPSRCRHLY